MIAGHRLAAILGVRWLSYFDYGWWVSVTYLLRLQPTSKRVNSNPHPCLNVGKVRQQQIGFIRTSILKSHSTLYLSAKAERLNPPLPVSQRSTQDPKDRYTPTTITDHNIHAILRSLHQTARTRARQSTPQTSIQPGPISSSNQHINMRNLASSQTYRDQVR